MNLDELVSLISADLGSVSMQGICGERADDARWRDYQIWSIGRSLRVEEPPGDLDLILGESTIWRRSPQATIVVRPRIGDTNDYTCPELLVRRPASYWLDWISADSHTTLDSIADVDFLGRDALRVTMPRYRDHALTYTFDKETGLELRVEVDGSVGVIAEWQALAIGDPVPKDIFELSGTFESDPT